MNRKERIAAIITQALSPNHLEVVDDSAKHAGHAGARPEGETHFTVIIESQAFEPLSKVGRHQLIYKLLDGELKGGLHALSIQAYATGER